MVELSNERIDQILHEETAKTEELTTILRSIYTRYMRLYVYLRRVKMEFIKEFENKYSANLLGSEWHDHLFRSYQDFRKKSEVRDKKAEFTKQTLAAFYDAMDYLFREGFGTGSQTVNDVVSGITGLLFGKEK